MKIKCYGRVKEKVLSAGELLLGGGAEILAGLERHV